MSDPIWPTWTLVEHQKLLEAVRDRLNALDGIRQAAKELISEIDDDRSTIGMTDDAYVACHNLGRLLLQYDKEYG